MRRRWLAMHFWGVGIWLFLMLVFAGPQPFFVVVSFMVAGWLWWGHMEHTPPNGWGLDGEPHPAVIALMYPETSPERQEALRMAWEELDELENPVADGSIFPKP